MEPHFNVRNKIILISGATSGIGKATANELVKNGARLIFLVRDVEKAISIRNHMVSTAPSAIDIIACDFSSLDSVRRAAESILETYQQIDVMINNAGIMAPSWRKITADGLELTMEVNYYAHFVLTGMLYPILKKSKQGRIINLSSVAYKYARLNLSDLNSRKHYSPDKVYSTSKLCMLLFTRELHRRMPADHHITVNAVHPGIINSDFALHHSGGAIGVFFRLFRPFLKSPEKGAETIVFLAGDSLVAGHNGKYWKNKKPQRVPRKFKNDQVASELWKLTERYTGFSFSTT